MPRRAIRCAVTVRSVNSFGFVFNLGKEHSVSVDTVTKMVEIKIKALSKKLHHLIFSQNSNLTVFLSVKFHFVIAFGGGKIHSSQKNGNYFVHSVFSTSGCFHFN